MFTKDNIRQLKEFFKQIHKPEIKYFVPIDFETYYADDYSLSKIPTEEYINHPEFRVHSVSVMITDLEFNIIKKVTGIANQSENFLGDRITEFFKMVPWDSVACIIQQAPFDGSILAWRYGIIPGFIFDTKTMALSLRGKQFKNGLEALAEDYNLPIQKGKYLQQVKGKKKLTDEEMRQLIFYNENDVEITWELFKIFFDKIPFQVLWNMYLVRQMYIQPIIKGDIPLLEQYVEEKEDERSSAIYAMGMADTEAIRKHINSPAKFAALIEKFGVKPPMKWSTKKECEIYAFAKTDPGMQELLEHEDPRVANLAAIKLNLSSNNAINRAQRYLETAKRWGGFIPMPIQPYGAHTGRGAGEEKMNPQNPDKKGSLRMALMAPDKMSLIAIDSGQNQARGAAYVARCNRMLDMFRAKDAGTINDIYVWFAANYIFNCTEAEIDATKRFISKGTVLGLQFGMGKKKFELTNNTTAAMADHAHTVYHSLFPEIKANAWYECEQACQAIINNKTYQFGPNGMFKVEKGIEGIKLPNGMFMKYPELRTQGNGFSFKRDLRHTRAYIWGGSILENIIQALEQVLMQYWRMEMSKFPHWFRFAIDMHDETVLVVPDDYALELAEYSKQVMETAPSWAEGLPLAAEYKIAKRYGDCK